MCSISPPIVFPLLQWVSEVTGVLRCQRLTEFPTSRWDFCGSCSEKECRGIKLIPVWVFFLFENECYYSCYHLSSSSFWQYTCSMLRVLKEGWNVCLKLDSGARVISFKLSLKAFWCSLINPPIFLDFTAQYLLPCTVTTSDTDGFSLNPWDILELLSLSNYSYRLPAQHGCPAGL